MKRIIMAVLLTSMCAQTGPAYGMFGGRRKDRVMTPVQCYQAITGMGIVATMIALYFIFDAWQNPAIYDCVCIRDEINLSCLENSDFKNYECLPRSMIKYLEQAGYKCACYLTGQSDGQ